MIWVDELTFDNKGHLIFNNNRLHELFGGELDWENEYNHDCMESLSGRRCESVFALLSERLRTFLTDLVTAKQRGVKSGNLSLSVKG